MSYQVPQHIDKDKIFIVRKSDIDRRLDPHYNRPSYNLLWNKLLSISNKLTTLKKESICIFSGITPKSGGEAYTIDKGIPFLRSGDFSEVNEIDFSKLLHIKENIHNTLMANSHLKNGDLLVAIVGATIGKIGVYKYCDEANINQAICAVRLQDTLNPYYVQAFLQTNIGQKIIERIKRPVARANINLEEVGNLPIPLLSPSLQKQIVEIMNNGRLQKQIKEAEAQQLLDSIDDYLLKELGIIVPTRYTSSIKNRIFTIKLATIERDRLDSIYFDKKFRILLDSIKGGIYPLHSLGDNDITSFISTGQTPKSDCYTEDETDFPIIKAGSYKGYEIDLGKISYTTKRQSHSAQKEDIFILSAAHQAEYIAKQICYLNETPKPNTSFVGELLCIRASALVNSMYLFSLLSTQVYKTLLNREKRGQTSHLYSNDVSRILIPLPPIEKQNDIAKHIETLRLKAKTLQAEGKAILEDAKRKVEQMIIGNSK